MALQVKFRHALGDRVLELPERGVAEPLVVGRAADADVQVPSVSASPRHCVLFVHDGRWAVQGTGGVTKVNGKPIAGPTPLSVGDRIAIGDEPSPPTLEIDPLGPAAGRSGAARARSDEPSATSPPSAPMRIAPAPMAPAWNQSAAPRPQPIAPPQPIYAVPAPAAAPAQEFSAGTVQDPAASDQVDWTAAAAPSGWAGGLSYRRRKKQSSGAGKVIAVLFGAAVLGGAAYYTYLHTRPPVVAPPLRRAQTQPAAPEPDNTPTFHSKLFDTGSGAQNVDRTNVNPAADPAAAGTGGAPPTGPANSSSSSDADAPEPARPAAADATWEDIQARHYEVERQGPAIVAFDEYRRMHPGKFDKELDRYTDDAVNWIWWQRVKQLWDQRDQLSQEIRKKKQEIRSQPADSFRDKLVAQLADLNAQFSTAQQRLTDEMGYANDTPPDVKNPAALRQLSKSRDPAKYAAFKKRILNYVRIHHGDLPW